MLITYRVSHYIPRKRKRKPITPSAMLRSVLDRMSVRRNNDDDDDDDGIFL